MSNRVYSSETSVETRLSYLYARRAVVDDLIRSLELYYAVSSESTPKKGAKRKSGADKPVWAQVLAS